MARFWWFQQDPNDDGFVAGRNSPWHFHPTDDVTKAAQNQTLGFGKIYYISLPQYDDFHLQTDYQVAKCVV
jgi:hypothetical protein